MSGAVAVLREAEAFVRRNGFVSRIPDVVSAQVLTCLGQGHLAAASHLAETHNLPLARGEPSLALALLEPLGQQAEAKGWPDERLRTLVLQALAYQVLGEVDSAMERLASALELAEPGGFIRIFADEGMPMAHLLSEAIARGISPDYVGRLLAVCEAEGRNRQHVSSMPGPHPLDDPLSQRELEVLHCIAQGLSNREISEKLFLSLDTVKGHNRKIFGKRDVQRRTEAIARARELGLLSP